MPRAGVLRIRWSERLRAVMLDAMEGFALSVLPRGRLRKRVLARVDRGFARIRQRRNGEILRGCCAPARLVRRP